MSCKVCDFLATLSDEELLGTSACLGEVVGSRWPGSAMTIDGNASPDEIAAAYAKSMNAIPAHLHKFLQGRIQ
jgi:hypothetical protein